ncbi:uncharacterized protein LOC119331329 [Triticum dicoccoides]|uniref:uncharacterized protein LOC119331329 n=1 Tax=Triticum dicoccoides TaxID=85692 RepID=UPI001891E093|nr:uncharacterized protein LOC119331329 [Triticum dicoccoides]XP_044426103.1 uncharacterized protein LOC123150311 [Triticum aestivum]
MDCGLLQADQVCLDTGDRLSSQRSTYMARPVDSSAPSIPERAEIQEAVQNLETGAISKEANNILAHEETKSKKQVLSKQVSSEADAPSFYLWCFVVPHPFGGETGTYGYITRSYIKFTFQCKKTSHHLEL